MLAKGDLTFDTVGALKNSLPMADEDGVAKVDLSGVSHVDSAGLALILYWAGQLDRQGQRVKLVGANAKIARLLGLIGMQDKLLN